MEIDAIRFCIGPWNGKYSSVWRIWSNRGSDDVYLGVRSMANILKVSLHKNKFRVAFAKSYNPQLIGEGKDPDIDRAFMKWDKKPVSDNEIMQALDIHFPLAALSTTNKPQGEKGKKLFILSPDKNHLEIMTLLPRRLFFTECVRRVKFLMPI